MGSAPSDMAREFKYDSNDADLKKTHVPGYCRCVLPRSCQCKKLFGVDYSYDPDEWGFPSGYSPSDEECWEEDSKSELDDEELPTDRLGDEALPTDRLNDSTSWLGVKIKGVPEDDSRPDDGTEGFLADDPRSETRLLPSWSDEWLPSDISSDAEILINWSMPKFCIGKVSSSDASLSDDEPSDILSSDGTCDAKHEFLIKWSKDYPMTDNSSDLESTEDDVFEVPIQTCRV